MKDVPVVDERPRPGGLVPKNAPTWLVLGLTLFMLIVLALSPTGDSEPAPAASSEAERGPMRPGREFVEEYRRRLQANAERLAEREARLREEAALAEKPPFDPFAAEASSGSGRQAVRERTEIERDRERRAYRSLFASNLTRSLRGDRPPSEAREGPPPPSGARDATVPVRPAAPSDRMRKDDPMRARDDAAAPPTYRIPEGTIIETVLVNRLDGAFSGPVDCLVTTPVLSRDRLRVLIPRGSRVLGEARRVEDVGQARLAVAFRRLMLPDGRSVDLERFPGLDRIGATGLKDKVDRHYLRVFGAALAVGAVGGLAGLGTSSSDSRGADYASGFAASSSQSSLRILDRFLNVLPTFVVREGHRVRVYLTADLRLPEYEPSIPSIKENRP